MSVRTPPSPGRRAWGLAVLCWPFAAGAQGAAAVQRAREFLTGCRTLQGRFTQTAHSSSGHRPKTVSGLFAFVAPNQLRWEYRDPWAGLLVVTDKTLWYYAPELQQVTKRSTAVVGHGPLSVLMTDPARTLELSFDRTVDGVDWVEVRPRVDKFPAGIVRLRVAMAGSALHAMDVQAELGERIEYRFSELVLNRPVAPEQFQFVPPAGVEVVDPDKTGR
jgi:outer membrane lipoprotein carrier protein